MSVQDNCRVRAMDNELQKYMIDILSIYWSVSTNIEMNTSLHRIHYSSYVKIDTTFKFKDDPSSINLPPASVLS